jgi:hypothetical protein
MTEETTENTLEEEENVEESVIQDVEALLKSLEE